MSFASLPPELLNAIIKLAIQIPFRHDLSNLSMTCKTLKDCVLPVLYKHLVLKVPLVFTDLSHLESLIDPIGGAEGLQHTTSISIVPQLEHFEKVDRQALMDGALLELFGDVTIPHVLASNHLNTLLRFLLKKIRQQSLTNFSWEHMFFMTSTTIRVLQESQLPGIKKLRIDNLEDLNLDEDAAILPGIESFTMRSINRGEEYMSDFIVGHRNTLKCLCLGAELHVLRDYHVSHAFNEAHHDSLPIRENYVDELIDSLEFLRESDDLRPWLSLRDLQLVGLSVRKFIRPASRVIDFQSLSSLSLESCPGLGTALDTLATESNESGLPLRSCLRLQSFSLRHEYSNQNFRTRLIKFLSAIQGLTHLSILLEDDDRSQPNDLDPLLAVHGQSLRSLVWDERSGKRRSFIPTETASVPVHLRLRRIAIHCPNLVELGISIDWRDFTVDSSFSPYSNNRRLTGEAFARLKNLKTLNIRNMPFIDPKKMALPLSEIYSSFANSLLRILLCSDKDVLIPTAPQNLKSLALGALTYRDVYNGVAFHRTLNWELHEFLRLKIYRVVRSYHEGESLPRPLAVLTETGTYEKTEANGGDVNVFKPYWLG
ncbi:MAG: hypothetical protein Q9226_008515 [Calogaya cf. arnoldii]